MQLAGFTSGSGDDVDRAVKEELKNGAKGVVFDLRHNGGGLLNEAVEVASVFLKDGRVVSTKGRARAERKSTTRRAARSRRTSRWSCWSTRASASASEIVAGALQDRKRAKIVGTRTYGKGVFQEIMRLDNGGALDITVGEYFTPTGATSAAAACKKGAGITPDDPGLRQSGDGKKDEALDKALATVAAKPVDASSASWRSTASTTRSRRSSSAGRVSRWRSRAARASVTWWRSGTAEGPAVRGRAAASGGRTSRATCSRR